MSYGGFKLVADKSSIKLGAAQDKRATVQFLWFTVDVTHLTEDFLVQRQLLSTWYHTNTPSLMVNRPSVCLDQKILLDHDL